MTGTEKKIRVVKTLAERIVDAKAAVVAAEQKLANLEAAEKLEATFNDVSVDSRIAYEYGRGETRGMEQGKVLAVFADGQTKKLVVLPDNETKPVTIRTSQVREVL